MAEQQILYDTKAAGEYLGGKQKPISERTLERWRQDGTGPEYLKVGNAVRYAKAALDTFQAYGRRCSTSQPPQRLLGSGPAARTPSDDPLPPVA